MTLSNRIVTADKANGINTIVGTNSTSKPIQTLRHHIHAKTWLSGQITGSPLACSIPVNSLNFSNIRQGPASFINILDIRHVANPLNNSQISKSKFEPCHKPLKIRGVYISKFMPLTTTESIFGTCIRSTVRYSCLICFSILYQH